MRNIPAALALAVFLAGCQTAPSNVPPKPAQSALDPEIEEASADLEESKSDYDSCVRAQDDDPEINCEMVKEMYDEDQAAYDDLLRRRKAAQR